MTPKTLAIFTAPRQPKSLAARRSSAAASRRIAERLRAIAARGAEQ